jgi:glycosyltransferase involved in cell wall biosynthesis
MARRAPDMVLPRVPMPMKDATTARPAEESTDPAPPRTPAEIAAENQRLKQDMALLTARLTAIETSTSWRFMVRIHRVLWWSAAVLGRAAQALPALARRLRQHFTAPPVDPDLIETCLVPRWEGGRWVLALDQARLKAAQRTQAKVTAVTVPYVVRPLRPADPARPRPRVLHVIANVYVGGSTQLIIDLLEHLADRYDQDVVTAALWPGGAHQGMVTHHFPAPLDGTRFTALLAARKPDIVHIHYWGLTDEVWYRSVLHAAVATACKIVQNINTPIAPMIHPRVDHYIYVSAYVRDAFGAGANDPMRSSVIHPGIDLSKFDHAIDEEQAADAVGMVYRLEPDKLRADAIQLFIEIARRRPQTRIYIVGGGSLFRTYVEQTKAAGVRENFHFTGYVPYDALPALYDRFCVFVAPVWQESFGQVTVFGMNKQQAVGGFRIGALPEILGCDDTFGDDVASAAQKIIALLDDPARRRVVGARNRERAQTAFGVAAMTTRYGDIYDRLLSGAP